LELCSGENHGRGQESRYEAIALLRTGDWRECKEFNGG